MRRLPSKPAIFLTVALLAAAFASAPASALEEYSQRAPYTGYSYSPYDGTLLYGPESYIPASVLRGTDLLDSPFKNPQDLFIDEKNGRIYVADTGNARIVMFDKDLGGLQVLDRFTGADGTEVPFVSPDGLFVTGTGELYVADKGLSAVIGLNPDFSLKKIYSQPTSKIYDGSLGFKPEKVAVSTDGNVYIVCEGLFEGVVELAAGGEFLGYVGVNLVVPNVWELFWRAVSTRQQRTAMKSFIPVDFNSLDIDTDNFVYTVSQLDNNASTSAVKRLNPGGTDVLRNSTTFAIMGDLNYLTQGQTIGSSLFADIAVMPDGIYAAADSKRSRIFVYDSYGVMLFAFGGSGSLAGNFTTIGALDNDGRDLYVLDAGKGTITRMQPTAYGSALLSATANFQNGDYRKAVDEYRSVLKINSNCESAYQGIALSQLQDGDYTAAMHNFRLANDRINYSKAFKQYRKELFSRYFVWFFGAIVLLLLFLALRQPVRRLLRRRAGGAGTREDTDGGDERLPAGVRSWLSSLDFCFYPSIRPFKGFWELKKERRGTLSGAFTLILAFATVMLAGQLFTGYIFNYTDPDTFQPLRYIVVMLVPILLFCVSNWCLTTLMDGEGNVRDIIISVAYALVPVILTQIAAIILSNLIIRDENIYRIVLEYTGYIWTGALLLIGNMTIHNYEMGKAVGMMVLTLVGIAVIVFLALVFINLAYEIYNFGFSIYYEILFR